MDSWIKHVWVSTQECGTTLLMDFADYPPQRSGDISLMQLFIKSSFKQPTLQVVNNCHLYLRIFLLSDIVTGSGNQILSQFWDQYFPATSPLEWPETPRPSPQAWSIWKQALTQALHLGRHQRLALPLGKWLTPSTSSTGWFYHPSTNSLWHKDKTKWQCHGGIPQHTRQQGFHQAGQTDTPPPLVEMERATINYAGQKLVLTGRGKCKLPSTGQDPCYLV